MAAHMIDNVLPRVPYRQWVVETTIRENSPDAPLGTRFGAVAFVHRFGSYLNSHVHFHVVVTDGVFSLGADDTAVFHPALHFDQDDYLAVQTKMRHRSLQKMGLEDGVTEPESGDRFRKTAARCWAMLLARV